MAVDRSAHNECRMPGRSTAINETCYCRGVEKLAPKLRSDHLGSFRFLEQRTDLCQRRRGVLWPKTAACGTRSQPSIAPASTRRTSMRKMTTNSRLGQRTADRVPLRHAHTFCKCNAQKFTRPTHVHYMNEFLDLSEDGIMNYDAFSANTREHSRQTRPQAVSKSFF